MPTSVTHPASPAVEDVDRVAAMADPVLRNLLITHHYHVLAVCLGSSTGPGANWCTFATWASRQAGQTIRGEDALDIVERRLRTPAASRERINALWRRLYVHAVEQRATRRSLFLQLLTSGPLTRASDAVARGNRKVYAEIAREFARFVPLCGGGAPAPEALEPFLDSLRAGPPPDGQAYLRRAFTHYAAALQATDRDERAELMLLGNLLIGLHEQTRLQPEILAALEVPWETMRDVGRSVLHTLFPSTLDWHRVVLTPAALLAGALSRGVELIFRRELRHLITELMMTLALPDVTVHLGRDVRGEYPACVRNPRSSELSELLARYRPAADDRNGVGAYDWSVLDERMQLITQLFRLHHEDASLFRNPYTPEQVTAFKSGRLPGGHL